VGWSISMVLNLGLSGQPLSGPDIGGFVGAGSKQMFARWMGLGALLPFARGHTGKGNIDKEPWSFGGDVEDTCRRALERRYRLLPYLYTLMREAAESGLPPARPLFFADPADARLRAVDDQFLLGSDLMVVAALEPAERTAPLVRPTGLWRPVHLVAGEEVDADLPDLYLRGGAILPVGPIMQYTGAATVTQLELLVSLDDDQRAEGYLYEDAGDGYGYQRGAYRLTRFTYDTNRESGKLRAEIVAGDWPAAQAQPAVRVLGGSGQ
jgi:alpha-glucosidase